MKILIEEMSKNENAQLIDIIDFVKKEHKGQRRKFGNKEAYSEHPIRVFSKIYNLTDDFSLASAALMHDILEDTEINYAELEDRFGTKVAKTVLELTSDKNEIKLLGKTKYLINKMNKISDDALTIKLIDRLDNVSDFDVAPVKWLIKYLDQTYDILSNVKPRNALHKKIMSMIYEKVQDYEYYLES